MSNVQIWNGSTWINFYTLPNATSSTLGGVKIGNNITVSSGTISLTKSNVTSALGYTPLSLSGGTMTGAISYKGTKATYPMIKWIDNTADNYGNGIRIGGGGATIIGGGESADLPNVSGGDEILYLMNDGNIDFYSNCQGGLSSAKHMSFDTSGNLNVPTDVKASGNIYEGGTALSSKYAAASHNHNSAYLPLSGGNISGHIYLTGSNAISSTGNTSQVVFGTVNNQHIVLSANDKALIINPTTSNTANQIVLYLNQQSVFPSGITSNGTINASTLQENGTSLSSKYLGISAEAADSSKLNGQSANYYATAASVTSVSDNLELLERELDDGSFIVRGANGDGDGNTISSTYATKTEATTASKKTSSANSTSKLFLIGATSQSADASTTYSNSKCYVDTDNCLYSNNTKVLTSHAYRPIQVNGSTILTSGSSTVLNLKAGTNISLSNSNGTVTINSTASGGGITSSLIFAGAGDTSGYYTQTLSGGGYKILLFEVNINDVDFYLSVPTDYIKTGSKTLYLAAGNIGNGSMGIVEITASNTNFSASVSNGNIMIWNVNVYAYK